MKKFGVCIQHAMKAKPLTEVDCDPVGTATGRCGVPVRWSFVGGSLVGPPLLVPAARNGELIERFAGIEGGDPAAGSGAGGLELVEDEGTLGTSTGTGVTGNCERSGRWLNRQ